MAGNIGTRVNCLTVPIVCVEEISSQKREQPTNAERQGVEIKRPFFQIGGVSNLCSRISIEEENLPCYRELLVEEGAATDSFVHTFPFRRYELVANVAKKKDLHHHLQTNGGEAVNKSHKITGQPKLIELYQFSGVDETDLPNGVHILDILKRVGRSQRFYHGRSKYKLYFEKIFYSTISQSILKDVFWWIYLNIWKRNAEIQRELFERISHSYVQLIVLADHTYFYEPFMKSYPLLLSQSAYAAFCEAFSDSYSNFSDDFKETVVTIVYQWLTGLKPTARSWLKWNLEELEPEQIRNRKHLLRSSSSIAPHKPSTESEETDLSLIASTDETKLSLTNRDSKKSTTNLKRSSRRMSKESVPVGRGPDFVPVAFRLNGQSPLVSYFLQKMNLEANAGTEMVVRRTEIENLPSLDAPTYSELVSKSYKSIKKDQMAYREFYARCEKENREFSCTQMRAIKKLREKEALLLGRPSEVKRLSNIITLECTKDKDSSSKFTRQVIERAINAIK